MLAPSNNFEGISIWYNSSELAFSFKDIIRAGLFNLLFKLNKASFNKFRELGESKKANRNETITGGYYFLDMIGVDPPCQNQGYAKIMIETKLEIIDENKMPCYLETSNIANADYYNKYGFRMIDENNFHDIKTYSLYRESKNK